jgi:hypothetical protein
MTTVLDEFGKSFTAGKFFIDVVAIYRNTTGSDSVEVARWLHNPLMSFTQSS